jgi:nucleoside-binding protein
LGAATAAGLAALAGCSGSGGGDSDAAADIGMIYATGGLGDDSFNDLAQAGAQRAEEELGITFDQSEPEAVSQFNSEQKGFAEGNKDLIVTVGFQQAEALSENAVSYPDQNWMIIDSVVTNENDEPLDNVRNYLFAANQGSFQVGNMAGLLTTEDFAAGDGETNPDETTVGFVGGVESPLIGEFQAGFEAGVEFANPEVNVVSSYTGSFNDTAAGQEAALSMYQDEGADIIYHAAGATGIGMFQAAEQEGRFAIGVDDDQSQSTDFENVILASMLKNVDEAVYDGIELVVNDEFSGGTEVLELADNGVGVAYGSQLGDSIPDSIKSALEDSASQINNGDITVPTEP